MRAFPPPGGELSEAEVLPDRAPDDELVVLVHGLSGKRWLMTALETRLQGWGYRTQNWTYPSLRGSLVEHAERLARRLDSISRPTVHLVAHSMGAIIARLALARARGISGRFVMLAPPNHGTPWARVVAPVLGRAVPAIGEMSSGAGSLVHGIGTPSPESGIVAARFDLFVPRSSTSLPGVPRVVLVATHNSVLFQRRSARMVHRFLSRGSFA